MTKQMGDQRYSETTHTDSKGEKQQIESFEYIEKGDWIHIRRSGPNFASLHCILELTRNQNQMICLSLINFSRKKLLCRCCM